MWGISGSLFPKCPYFFKSSDIHPINASFNHESPIRPPPMASERDTNPSAQAFRSRFPTRTKKNLNFLQKKLKPFSPGPIIKSTGITSNGRVQKTSRRPLIRDLKSTRTKASLGSFFLHKKHQFNASSR